MGSAGELIEAGAVSRQAVMQGDWWVVITSAFLHLGLLHIAFNMYILWVFGPVIEQLYGHLEYLVLYLLCALGGSVLTILVAPDTSAVGASGAIFGLFGLAFVVSRRRHLLLGPQARGILSQAGGLLMLNLIITFVVPGISWTGHVGGLLVGALIGLMLVPSNVPTMGGMWRAPDGRALAGGSSTALRAAAYLLVAAILGAGYLFAVNVA
jgi:membrane associated rhomboid family serine protease